MTRPKAGPAVEFGPGSESIDVPTEANATPAPVPAPDGGLPMAAPVAAAGTAAPAPALETPAVSEAADPATEAPEAADPATPATTRPIGVASPVSDGDVVDPSRRQFFRRFAGDMLTSAAQVVGVVTDIRDRSAAEASALLGDASPVASGNPPGGADRSVSRPSTNGTGASAATPSAAAEAPTGFRTPYRFESDNVLLVIDQRKLPDQLVEIPVRSASDAATAIKLMVVRGAPAIGQVAAIGLALTARMAAKSQGHARRAILEGAANTLRGARPTAINLRWAVDRLMDRYHAIGALSDEGPAIAAAMHDEAMAIVAEATDDHGRLAQAGLEILPTPEDRPLRILTHCNTGPLACGQFGTALGVVQAAHSAERPLHVWVDETRPYLQGARLTAWELRQAEVPHTLIPDMAAGPLMARGEVDVILVGADRIVANGDTANKLGTFTLAVLAERYGIPFIVCAPMSSVDLATETGDGIPIEDRAAVEVTDIRGIRIAPEGTRVKNPSFDVTPNDLITAIVTEEGALRQPYLRTLREAMERRDARRDADKPYALEPVAPVGSAF